VLTPAQEAEARRFAEVRIEAQLATEPVDEAEAEGLLEQAYAMAGLAAPQQIHRVDGPLHLVAVLALPNVKASLRDSVRKRVIHHVQDRVAAGLWASFGDTMRAGLWHSIMDTVGVGLWHSVGSSIRASLKASPEMSLRDNSGTSLRAFV
jgi:hypothetical protein